jgi:hypothetical protein
VLLAQRTLDQRSLELALREKLARSLVVRAREELREVGSLLRVARGACERRVAELVQRLPVVLELCRARAEDRE